MIGSKYQNRKTLSNLDEKKWDILTFNDVFIDDTRKATKVKKEDYLETGDFPIVDQGKDYIAGYTNLKEEVYDNTPLIIFGDHTRILKYIDFPIFIGADGVKLLKNRFSEKEVLTKYLYYYLCTINIPDTGYNRHFKYLKEIVIPIPDIEMQKRIVQILDKAQELIDKRKAQIEALDQLTQSVFLEMFGDPVTNPNGWEIVNLQDIADYFIGLTYKPNDVSDEGIVVLRSSNIQNGVIDLNDIVRVKKEVNDKLLVKQNDILMCSRNGSARLVGKVALIPELEERMTFGAFMTIIRSRYYCYLYNYFQSSAFRRQITSGATTTINQITKKMLNYVKLPLPPTSLQNEFAHKVEQIQHQKEILQTSLLELENMYNSLMQKAFKGELFTEEKVSNL